MRLARLAALERKKIEDEYLAVIQQIAELEDILANPARVLQIIKDELAELKKKYAGERKTRVADDSSREMTDEDLIADEDVVVTIIGPRLHQAPAGRDVPPPAPRRQGHHRPRHPRGGRGRAPDRREHPRLGAVLHEPRPRVQREGPRDRRRQPPGEGHADHQPAGRPGRGRRGPDGDDRPARTSSRQLPGHGHPRGSSRRRRSSSSSASARPASGRSRSTTNDELAWVDVSTGEDDIIIATREGKIARFAEDEVRRWAATPPASSASGCCKQAGDSVVAMIGRRARDGPARADRDGYGKRSR
jgi:DNA gyrase subunit A